MNKPKYRRFGNAQWTDKGNIYIYLDINSWPTMQLIRKHLSKWLPDLPTWKNDNHYCEKAYFRNTFHWDGEYSLILDSKAKEDVEELLLKPVEKCR